jgi:hypothetical protein
MLGILCTRVNGKMRTVETTLRRGGGEIKKKDGGGEYN